MVFIRPWFTGSSCRPTEVPKKSQKVFTSSELRIWDGKCSPDLKLLVVGEQGIGDSMMFATLIPQLSKSGLKITFVPGDRLVEIYKRSFSGIEILTHHEMLSRKAENFDAQIPAGTLPRLYVVAKVVI